MIVDDGGDLTLLIHWGVDAENEYEKSGQLPDPSTALSHEKDKHEVLKLLREHVPKKPSFFRNLAKHITGTSEETTTGVHRFE